MRRRLWSVFAVTAVAVVVLTGCWPFDDQPPDGDSTGTSGSADTEVPPAEPAGINEAETAVESALLEELLASPQGIAASINAVSSGATHADEVASKARELCLESYNSSVTTNWLLYTGVLPQPELEPPARRLLLLAQRDCLLGEPDLLQTVNYYTNIHQYMTPDSLLVPEEDADKKVCDFLNSPSVSAAATNMAEWAYGFTRRHGGDPGDVIKLAMALAGAACGNLIPIAEDALNEVEGSE